MSEVQFQPAVTAGPSGVLLRAVFLACSWTWCIGMWLPVYLCMEFGWPGWVAFLVPNCIGAAAVGVVLRSRADSERLESKHPAAMRWFSIITVAFHIVFLSAIFPAALESIGVREASVTRWFGLMVAATVAVVFAIDLDTRRWRQLGAVVYLASMVCLILTAKLGQPGTLAIPPGDGPGRLCGLSSAFPVIALGFLLCPILDLTFHRVRRESGDRQGSYAFIIGFAFFFPPLVAFTLLYAGGYGNGLFHWLIALHIVLQSLFTIGVHLRELAARQRVLTSAPGTPWHRRPLLVRVYPAVGIAMFILYALTVRGDSPLHAVHRQMYELFMSMYGLVFPGYVWIVMIGRGVAMRARVAAWVLACLLAAPIYWVGYIQQHYAWLLGGVGVVLAAPLALRVLRGSGAR